MNGEEFKMILNAHACTVQLLERMQGIALKYPLRMPLMTVYTDESGNLIIIPSNEKVETNIKMLVEELYKAISSDSYERKPEGGDVDKHGS